MNQPMNNFLGLFFVLIFTLACEVTGNAATSQPATLIPPGDTTAFSTDTPFPNDTPLPPDNTNPIESGACANPYYPVLEGSTWAYQSTGSIAGPFNFTDTITDLRSDGYTLTSQFDKLTRTQEWACDADGLKALQFSGAGLSTQNMSLQIQTQNASGVTYPKNIAAGNQWDYALDFTGTMEIGGNPGDAKGNETVHFTAVGIENVTVPAGTFNALKIQGVTTLNISVTYQGITVPVTFTSTYTYWFVQDVGWVQAEGTGEMGGQSFSEHIELQWYNIPR